MTGERNRSDLSARLKRPMRNTARSSKAHSPSRISAPPKAAIITSSSKKSDLHRHKNPFNEMLLHESSKDASRSSSPTPEAQEHIDTQEHKRCASIESIQSVTDARTVDKVAELERALVLAREELDKVRQHSLLYRETIEDYRRQLGEVYSHRRARPESPSADPAQMDIDHNARPRRSFNKYREEELMEQNYDLRRRLAEIQEQMVAQDAVYRAKLEQQVSSKDLEWNNLAARLHRSEKESQERLQQLLDLKHSISALTRMESQVTDSELAERADQLCHRTREWVVTNYRRTRLDFSGISKDTSKALTLILPHFDKIDTAHRLAFYQSIVSSYLMRIFHEPLCVGLPETGLLASIRQVSATVEDTGSEYAVWRRATIRALQKSTAKQLLEAEEERVLGNMVEEIQHHLYGLTSVTLAPPSQAALLNILSTAADLHQALVMQKAEYKVLFFRNREQVRIPYDDAQMENINDQGFDEEDGSKDRKFEFCVFPCLEKFGNEAGEHLDVRNVLLKARVCCERGRTHENNVHSTIL